MNRENFDMDGSPSYEEPENKNNKNSNRLIVVLFFILLILCLVAGYIYITNNNQSKNNESSQIEKVEDKKTIIETIDTNNENSEDIDIKNISESDVSPVLEDNEASPQAMDISKVKAAKAAEGAVKFNDHIVRANEDLNSIAAIYGLKVQTLISINEIKNISGVVEGVSLRIPDRNGRYYTVKSGDMLSTIANEYCPNLGWKTLQEINGLSDTRLDVGDKIFIPDMSDIIASPAINTASNKFIMPSDGTIVAKYGQFMEDNPYNDDISLDGILIKTSNPIHSSAEGVVVDKYNYNNKKVIKLSHEGGYESLYGNLQSTDLTIGQDVSIQDIIGELSSDKILYFSIIQSGIPLDPESFF